MLDLIPSPGGGCLETSQHLLVQAINFLEEANTTHQTLTNPSSSPKSSSIEASPLLKNITTALDRLSQLHTLLFGPRSEDGQSSSRWSTQSHQKPSEVLEEKPIIKDPEVLELVLGGEASCGEDVLEIVKETDAESSPPQRCDTLLPYQPSLNLNEELKQFRKLIELRFESIPNGIPRFIVEKVAELEILFHLTRDQTTDCVWNVDHQTSRIELFTGLNTAGVFRQKCVCVPAEGSEEKVHATDPHCPKNKKDEDRKSSDRFYEEIY